MAPPSDSRNNETWHALSDPVPYGNDVISRNFHAVGCCFQKSFSRPENRAIRENRYVPVFFEIVANCVMIVVCSVPIFLGIFQEVFEAAGMGENQCAM